MKIQEEESEQINEEIIEYIKGYVLLHGYYPSNQEIGEEIGYQQGSVTARIKILINKGLLESEHGARSRAFRLPGYKVMKG